MQVQSRGSTSWVWNILCKKASKWLKIDGTKSKRPRSLLKSLLLDKFQTIWALKRILIVMCYITLNESFRELGRESWGDRKRRKKRRRRKRRRREMKELFYRTIPDNIRRNDIIRESLFCNPSVITNVSIDHHKSWIHWVKHCWEQIVKRS